MLTLASQRSWPFSMSPSEMPSQRTRRRSVVRNAAHSAGSRKSGCVTSSSSGTPARLKSTRDTWRSPCRSGWNDLPVSSSAWTRIKSNPRRVSPSRTGSAPPSHSGRSYWVIW